MRRASACAVLLHGFTGSAAAWGDPALDGLRAAGVEPRPLDLPGHGSRAGESDEDFFTLERVVDEVGVALGRARRETEGPVALLGYSMGGRIALHCALAHGKTVDVLVLESASPGLAAEDERAARRAADAELAERIVAGGVESFVDEWEALPLFASQAALPAQARDAQRRIRLANHAGSLAACLRTLGTGSLPSLWERLEQVRTPTLVLAGALDPKFVGIGTRMTQAMRRAELRVVPDAGHTVHRERPRAWIDAVAGFIARSQGPPES